jgi:hypothetical protein
MTDAQWYLSVRHYFCFDGKPDDEIPYDRSGLDGIAAFVQVDTYGRKAMKPTRHPNIYKALVHTKGAVNLHIKMYAEDRAKGYLPDDEFGQLCMNINPPKWFIKAIENQAKKFI